MPLGRDDVRVFVSSELETPAKGESKPSYNDIVQLYKQTCKCNTQLLQYFKRQITGNFHFQMVG
ncbi:hypothetical protein T4B_8924 [Trichinella pseudospiralis]|uniref:Uncharacterized protein n=2 Tax=Trichinella pseudospiralis TaxID=6337 RepID=A0A0V1F9L7_TRIPS|nr:hypothetical protein T4E_8828 [Trichinella pseudospiralis]KRY82517.1 hypothetical protein T4D_3871 [Trichinella pseudospiralis]KRZ22020.1 hypothetical protein T4B_8924 [Trichinella pseudospiralis]